jgi:hypothetical protein
MGAASHHALASYKKSQEGKVLLTISKQTKGTDRKQ